MTIVAAIDGDEHSGAVVDIGYDMATTYDVPLEVIHVAPKEEFEAYQKSLLETNEFSNYSISQHKESAAKVSREIIKSTLGDRNTSAVTAIGRVGNPVEEILDHAAEADSQFIVIGGRKRSPTGKAIFGSATQSILLESDGPVVTVMSEDPA